MNCVILNEEFLFSEEEEASTDGLIHFFFLPHEEKAPVGELKLPNISTLLCFAKNIYVAEPPLMKCTAQNTFYRNTTYTFLSSAVEQEMTRFL